jgi:ribosomal protein L19
MNILQEIEREHAAALAAQRAAPDFRPGDTLRVNVRITEGDRTRVQAFEGVCIARSGGGIKRSQAFMRHILTKKSTKRKRHLRGTTEVHHSNKRQVKSMLPYSS